MISDEQAKRMLVLLTPLAIMAGAPLVGSGLAAQEGQPLIIPAAIGSTRPLPLEPNPVYQTLRSTPVGALPSIPAELTRDSRAARYRIQLHYGSSAESESPEPQPGAPYFAKAFPPRSQRSKGVSIGMPIARGSFAATMGVVDPECEGLDKCASTLLYGGSWETRLFGGPPSAGPDASWVAGFSASVGYGRSREPRELSVYSVCFICRTYPPDSIVYIDLVSADYPEFTGHFLSLTAGIPLVVRLTRTNAQFLPFVIPTMVYGRRKIVSEQFGWGFCPPDMNCGAPSYPLRQIEQIDSETRLSLGGGLAVAVPDAAITIGVAFQRMFVDGAKPQFGFTLAWQPAR